MKFLHLSDLHIGKRVHEFSMIEDQKYILKKIIAIAEEEQVDGVLIAGDVYDKSVPSAEAVTVFDAFLTSLADKKRSVFIISGNHDSAERLSFGADLMKGREVFFAPVYDGAVTRITKTDAYGEVNVYLLPFIKPSHVRAAYPKEEITSYHEAVQTVIEHLALDETKRNVLVAHQFVTGASRCDSEELSVGGVDNVEAYVFDGFDYVALGHIHGPQHMKRETVRYCGTPLKYSFSEARHKKTATIVELKEKGTVNVRTVPLMGRRDMREIKGTYMELTNRANYEGTHTDDYLHIILTDEEEIPDALGKLRTIYPNLLRLTYDNARTRAGQKIEALEDVQEKQPIVLFEEFYERQNNKPMSKEQYAFLNELIETIWEESM